MEKKDFNTRMQVVGIAIITTALVVYILIIGKAILLPLLIAIVIWYLVIRLTAAFSTIPYTKIQLPNIIALLLALVATALFIYGFAVLVTHSIYSIIQDAPKYQAKLTEFLNYIGKFIPYKFEYKDLLGNINFTAIFSNAALTITYITGNLTLIIIYVLFLLFEYKSFHLKIKAMCKSKYQLATVEELLNKMAIDINTYMKVKTGVSLLTAISSYIILIAFGIKHAQFWALLIFLLNYIPTVGSIVAVAFVLLAVTIQFTSIWAFLFLSFLLILVQLIIGNIVEPKFMGKNLNLSPLVILLALTFWGAIWGILGMFLCVPLMTILNIVLSKFERTRNFAILFSSDPSALADK